MQDRRQFVSAALFALASAGLVVGGLSLSLAEYPQANTPTASGTAPVATRTSVSTAVTVPTVAPATLEVTSSPTQTASALPPVACQIPAGWLQAVAQSGDTLASIAARYRSTASALRAANCLDSDSVPPGSLVYVPPVSISTIASCSAGASGWNKGYVVSPGDTMYRIATYYGTTVSTLQKVNCRTSDLLKSGELLWVPNTYPAPPAYPATFAFETVAPEPTAPLTETPLPFTLTPLPFTASPSPTAE